ncbi:hypothetical protein B5M47_00965 [candidate division CPR3 bacterium 4484_211]|uniref:VTT domain-containing protein n=1 Tax=candidate division CPR3 bacterium 4484_211 TaxID=1968527 RepID=A0A1W9NZ64_UNCC3|nr:MAG: hypothetical protein B5M47_00965 [candidate division CPR3 bacterium 4484_211]
MIPALLSLISQFALNIISALGYPGIVAIMALENVFPPIPSEVVMPFAGFLATQGKFNLIIAILMGTLGSVLGAIFWYAFGAWGNEIIVRNFFRKFGRYLFLSESDLDKALEQFKKRGELIIFTGRLIPIIRSLISIPAGLSQMNWGKFLFFTTLGTGIWTAALTIAGKLLGENWELVGGWLEKYENLVLAIIIIASFFFLYHKYSEYKTRSAKGMDDHLNSS